MPICLSRIKRYSATDTSECALMVDPHGRLRLVTHTGPLERGARSGWAPAHHPLRDSWREGQDYSKSAHDWKVTIQSGHPDRRHRGESKATQATGQKKGRRRTPMISIQTRTQTWSCRISTGNRCTPCPRIVEQRPSCSLKRQRCKGQTTSPSSSSIQPCPSEPPACGQRSVRAI